MMKVVNVILAALMLSLLFTACDKDKNYPPEPWLEFNEYVPLVGDSLRMISSFRDGDGDIGSKVGDDCPVEFDVRVGYQEMINGEWLVTDTYSDECVLSLTPEGQDKTLEGRIEANFPHPLAVVSGLSDTVRYSMVLQDRAGNVSNTVIGPMLVLE